MAAVFLPPLIFFSVRFSDLGNDGDEHLSASQKILTFYKAPVSKFAGNVVSKSRASHRHTILLGRISLFLCARMNTACVSQNATFSFSLVSTLSASIKPLVFPLLPLMDWTPLSRWRQFVAQQNAVKDYS